MSNTFEVTFPGGVRVDTTYRGHTIRTDQPAPYGDDTAPPPFDLFLASLATCAGLYALRFCQERQIATDGLSLSMSIEREPEKKRVSRIGISLTVPPGFPEKYESAIIRAMDQCAVKKAIANPPEFEVGVVTTAAAASESH
jgi:ribosomal protein S12 methylthiotransferase accessory factor